jgi:NADH:ubiquinone oxidoreductase subunit 2 (subunit N)
VFTFSVLYIVVYIFTIFSLFGLFISFNSQDLLLQLSFTRLISGYCTYINRSGIISFLILTLSGLPPTFVFFLKANFMINILYNTELLITILIIINLIVGVFFYIHFYAFYFLENELLVFFSSGMGSTSRINFSLQNYNIYLIVYIILGLAFSGFFFFDFFIICDFLTG